MVVAPLFTVNVTVPWFTVDVLDHEGRHNPPDIYKAQPSQKIIVDTLKPQMQIVTAERKDDEDMKPAPREPVEPGRDVGDDGRLCTPVTLRSSALCAEPSQLGCSRVAHLDSNLGQARGWRVPRSANHTLSG